MKTKFKIIRKLLNIKKNPVHTDKTILKYDNAALPEVDRAPQEADTAPPEVDRAPQEADAAP